MSSRGKEVGNVDLVVVEDAGPSVPSRAEEGGIDRRFNLVFPPVASK